MKELSPVRSQNTLSTFSVNQSDHVNYAVVTPGTAVNLAVPADANHVLFNSNFEFFANVNTIAVIPAATITDGSGPDMNPGGRYLGDVSTISVISSYAATIMMAFYE
jgi:hypothetical protein